MFCGHRAQLRYRDLKIRQDFQQECLELHIGAVDLVDQQHRRIGAVGLDRLEQRPLDQIVLAENLGLDLGFVAMLDLFELDAQHLFRIVPFVQSRIRVEPLVTLEPDELGIEYFREHLGDLGFAHARLALQQKRLTHHQRKVNDRRQGPVADIFLF